MRTATAIACLLLAAAALGACGGDELSGEDPRLTGGGVPAFEARLESLRGMPVVVNQWASWCGPCRFEFPFFQEAARDYEGRVAFVGVNSRDAEPAALEFLDEFPTPFPHHFDPDVEIARSIGAGRSWPTTVFLDSDGEQAFTHQGAYASEEDLRADIERVLGGG